MLWLWNFLIYILPFSQMHFDMQQFEHHSAVHAAVIVTESGQKDSSRVVKLSELLSGKRNFLLLLHFHDGTVVQLKSEELASDYHSPIIGIGRIKQQPKKIRMSQFAIQQQSFSSLEQALQNTVTEVYALPVLELPPCIREKHYLWFLRVRHDGSVQCYGSIWKITVRITKEK